MGAYFYKEREREGTGGEEREEEGRRGKGREGRGGEGKGGEGRGGEGKERAMSPPPTIWRKFTPMDTVSCEQNNTDTVNATYSRVICCCLKYFPAKFVSFVRDSSRVLES